MCRKKKANNRSYDIILCGHELSIKTITNHGTIKVLWTVDTKQVRRELRQYKPQHDILLINIFWDKHILG